MNTLLTEVRPVRPPCGDRRIGGHFGDPCWYGCSDVEEVTAALPSSPLGRVAVAPSGPGGRLSGFGSGSPPGSLRTH